MDTQPIYHVTVPNEESGKVDNYFFHRLPHILASIAMTWSKMANDIVIVETNGGYRVANKKDGAILLETEVLDGMRVLDGPTHF